MQPPKHTAGDQRFVEVLGVEAANPRPEREMRGERIAGVERDDAADGLEDTVCGAVEVMTRHQAGASLFVGDGQRQLKKPCWVSKPHCWHWKLFTSSFSHQMTVLPSQRPSKVSP